MKFFVSYSRSVQERVRDIIMSLRDDGDTVWWDQDLRAGQDWWATILNTIESSDVCLFMISEKAVQSPYCMEELRYALNRNRLVLPFVMDGPISYTIPPEIMKGRIQYETYGGSPDTLKHRIRTTCKSIDWTLYKDRFAQRPPEPNTGSESLVDRLAKAVALAQEGVFDGAIEAFNNVAHNDHASYGDFCHTWIDRISRYKEIANLAQHASMRVLARPKWAAFLKQYAAEESFDPLGVQEKLIPASTPKPPPVSDDLQHVYDLIEQVRNAQAEGLPFGADPYLYELGTLGEVALQPVIDLLQDQNALMRQSAVNILGRMGDERAVEPIMGRLTDDDWEVRWAACHTLGMFADVRTLDPLIGMLNDPHAEVRDMAVTALSMLEDPRAVEPIIALLKDENEKVRASAARALGQLGDKRAIVALAQCLKDKAKYVRKEAEAALDMLDVSLSPSEEQHIRNLIEQIRNDKPDFGQYLSLLQKIADVGVAAVPLLISVLESEDDFASPIAAEILGDIGDSRAVEPLVSTLKNRNWNVRSAAIKALGNLEDERAVEVIIESLEDKNNEVRRSAAIALGRLIDERAFGALVKALHDSDAVVREFAAFAIAEFEASKVIFYLIDALQDSHWQVRRSIAEILGELGDARAVEALMWTLDDNEWVVRSNAATALGVLVDKRDGKAVIQLERIALRDENEFVRHAAKEALIKIKSNK